jgi:hypothetical protein
LIGTICGAVAQKIADEHWLAGPAPDRFHDKGAERSDSP